MQTANEGVITREKQSGHSWPLGFLPDDLVAQRFRILDFKGEGGMGWVFKALDVTLNRPVALKFMKHLSSSTFRHTLREARLQASIDHEAICEVYATGHERGHPFLAMQFLEGKPLGDFVKLLSVDAKLVIIQKVAMALHQAHALGMVHRDIKPNNILVCENGRGELAPYLVDFGLARRTQEERSTVLGGMAGTPSFMAPEQVRGEVQAMDRRTDVYGLGATLFFVLSGKAPHQANTLAATWVALLSQDAPSIRKHCPALDKSIAAIVTKALATDANHRYPSALAFAEDLQRFLTGRPVLARRHSPLARVSYFVRRHRWWFRTAAISGVLAVSLLIWSLLAQNRIQTQARIEKTFIQHTESMITLQRQLAMLPQHDIRTDRSIIESQMEQVRRDMATLGRLASGPGQFALGKAYLELGEPAKARFHLELAWNNQFRNSDVALTLVTAMKDLYFLDLAEVETLSDANQRKLAREQTQNRYRELTKGYLQSVGPDPQGNQWHGLALKALFEDKPADALDHWEELYKAQPLNYPALVYQGQLLTLQGDRQRDSADQTGALNSFDRAQICLEQAKNIARSDPKIRIAMAQVQVRKALMQQYDPTKSFFQALEQAREICKEGLRLDPENAEIYRFLGTLASMEADAQIKKGQDPSASLSVALQMAEKSLQLKPNQPLAFNTVGMVHLLRGRLYLGQGKEPLSSLVAAEHALVQGLLQNPNHPALNNNLGLVLLFKAQLDGNITLAENGDLEKGIDHFETALALEPHRKDTALNLGAAYWMVAEDLYLSGKDPSSQLCAASWSFDRVLAAHPEDGVAFMNRASVLQLAADFELGKGISSSEDYLEILADLAEAETQLPGAAEVANGKALAFLGLAKVSWNQNAEPFTQLELASEYALQALILRPNWDLALFNLGLIHGFAAQTKAMLGMSHDQDVLLAEAVLRETLYLNPDFADAWVSLGDLAILRSMTSQPGELFPESLELARERYQQALTLDDLNAYAYFGLAKHARLAASLSSGLQETELDWLGKALEHLNRARQLQPLVREFQEEFAFIFLQQWLNGRDEPSSHKSLAAKIHTWRMAMADLPVSAEFDGWVSQVFEPLFAQTRFADTGLVKDRGLPRFWLPSRNGKEDFFLARLKFCLKNIPAIPKPIQSSAIQKGVLQ